VSYRPLTAMLVWSVFPILPKCLFVIIVIYAYFIDISQGSVKTHLWCGRICNNHVIANCPQSVPVKEFWKSINNWRRYGQKWSGTFFWPTLYIRKEKFVHVCSFNNAIVIVFHLCFRLADNAEQHRTTQPYCGSEHHAMRSFYVYSPASGWLHAL